ncbi:MAG: molybdopterin molybdotransferase MoeA [Gemmatimonadetes bacterium]|nr:molybdopterin molybdotransferase MoeA [Gemmatimonadota bacterium]
MSRQGLTPTEAAAAIVAAVSPLPIEAVPLNDALDRVLATGVTSPIDVPAWDNSAMDGYAVRSEDVRGKGAGGAAETEGGREPAPSGARGRQMAEVVLRVIEIIPAGCFPTRRLGPGECARIFTGAPLPEGCDGVIRQEDTTPLPDDRVRIDDPRDAGRNVRYRGEDIRRSTVVFETGTELTPAHLGVLASLAQSPVSVRRRPRVAILGSGDEIVDLDEREAILAGRKIASSNSYTLRALLHQNGAEALDLGIARDDPEDLRARLRGAADADLLVTTAGVSVGEHDHVRTVLDELGLDLRFWRIKMRPGAPVGFGLLRGRPWIGLPGNPVSTMVTFELFVRPVIRKMIGHRALYRRAVPVRVGERIALGPRLRHFLRAVVTEEGDGRVARLTGPQGSGILTSMAKANALLIVPEDRPEVGEGETLSAILLEETRHVEEPPF